MLKYHFNCYDKGKKAKEKMHYRQLADPGQLNR